MMTTGIVIVALIALKLIFNPTLDITDDLWVLWWGRKNRKYIILYEK